MGILFSAKERIKEIGAPVMIENSLLSWIAVAGIFFLLSGTTGNFGKAGRKYFVAFIIIGLILLIITALDYIKVRREMMAEGYRPYRRTDYLFLVLVTAIFIVTFMVFEALFNNAVQINNGSGSNKYKHECP